MQNGLIVVLQDICYVKQYTEFYVIVDFRKTNAREI